MRLHGGVPDCTGGHGRARAGADGPAGAGDALRAPPGDRSQPGPGTCCGHLRVAGSVVREWGRGVTRATVVGNVVKELWDLWFSSKTARLQNWELLVEGKIGGCQILNRDKKKKFC